ncbi:pilus assembly protein PilM [Vibrio sp. SCSIO 43136]|uniref:type IV pilus biogenesis protein PilM n=1 Tax=Vibrio sp. SCSIO 43136 TaxID=2819101 RepID=UPI002075532A|nr:pilus assembly protein PilM [Vibrio sp. SCSIO 43136]USD65496.1 pilus assembly protein PilM [Vibrio sp. SCSIO 43136]
MATSFITGLDIGPHAIKAVLIKRTHRSMSVERCVSLRSQKAIFVDNHTLGYQDCVNLLKEVRKALPWYARKVALALPDNAAASKVLQLQPDLEEEELMFAVRQEMALQTSASDDDLYLDFYSVESLLSGSEKVADYQVIAAKKNVVDSHLAPVSKVGFRPQLMTLQGQALSSTWKLISQHQKDQQHGMLVYVWQHKLLLCTRPFNSEPYIKEVSLPPSHGDEDVAGQFVRLLSRQLNLYNSNHPAQKAAKIWLSGELSPRLELTWLAEQIELEVELVDALSLLPRAKKCSANAQADGFEIALGLALLACDWEEWHANH